jgi:hypothetical protein
VGSYELPAASCSLHTSGLFVIVICYLRAAQAGTAELQIAVENDIRCDRDDLRSPRPMRTNGGLKISSGFIRESRHLVGEFGGLVSPV